MKSKIFLFAIIFLLNACSSQRSLVFIRNGEPYQVWTKIKDCAYEFREGQNLFLPYEFGLIENDLIHLPGQNDFFLPLDPAVKEWIVNGIKFRIINDLESVPAIFKRTPITVVEVTEVVLGKEIRNHLYLRDGRNVVGSRNLNYGNLLVATNYPKAFYECSRITRAFENRHKR